MNVRKLRLQKGWSQEQLAEMTDLSIRTIQRIERGQVPSLESRKALASVFDIDLSDWQIEGDVMDESAASTSTERARIEREEREAIEYVRDLKAFYSHCLTFVVIIPFLFFINLTTSPGYIWAWWPAFGWGVGLAIHGINAFEVFNMFGPGWERKQVEKRLGRKL
ncbi:2TM domain-containing protein [Gilvimarinus algae]|uniref:2TM domain-containing protein n=1 Tax=Gilvimarinus algae TaxID=3058037 RepID=A0ABT8TCK9_9GAMM|nr:2TM domain-containing protein [Gilvimarinus sp. SDUM040014]MDO3381666.1 2TM domain-containing protein [Gilvimarinus sp. SDUM040014]